MGSVGLFRNHDGTYESTVPIKNGLSLRRHARRRSPDKDPSRPISWSSNWMVSSRPPQAPQSFREVDLRVDRLFLVSFRSIHAAGKARTVGVGVVL